MSYSSEATSLDLHAAVQPDSPVESPADLGIREFARHYGHSEAEVRRAMRQLGVSGSSPGRGRPTRLSPDEQGHILAYMEGPAEAVPALAVSGDPIQHQALTPRDWVQAEPSTQRTPIQSAPMQAGAIHTGAMHTGAIQNVPIQDMSHWDEPQEALQPGPMGGDRDSPSDYPMAHYPASAYPAHPGKLQISAGNHRTTVTPPPLPQSYDLAQFRGPEAIPAIADPGEVANQAMAAIDALVNGMEADIRQQRQQLQETQSAAQALRLKAKHLQDKKLEYMIQSTAIGQSQQRCTAEIQEALGEVQALGKSPRSEQEPPSP